MASFGKTAVGASSESNGPGFLVCNFDYVPVPASVVSVSVYLGGASADAVGRVALYGQRSDGKCFPGSLLGVSGEAACNPAGVAQWFTFSFASPVAVVPGLCWLAFWLGGTGSLTRYYDANGTLNYASATYSSTGNPPNPFGSGSYLARDLSIYATYDTYVSAMPEVSMSGGVASVTDGTYTETPTSVGYQWRQNFTNIAGQTASSYTVQPGDTAQQIDCVVTATLPSATVTAPARNAVSPVSYPSGRSWKNYKVPLLGPSRAEMCLRVEGGLFKMWSGRPLRYATCSTSADILDRHSWTDYGSCNVSGNGSSSGSPTVIRVDANTLRLFMSNGADLVTADSSDGINWSTPTVAIAGTALGTNSAGGWWGTSVWLEGSTWKMLCETASTGNGPWKTYYAEGTDGKTFTPNATPLSTLAPVPTSGCYGGNMLVGMNGPIGGVYYLFFHGSSVSGQYPTDIYFATSADAQTWTVYEQVAHNANDMATAQQRADAFVVEANNKTYLFTTGSNTGNPADWVTLVSVWDGSFASFLKNQVLSDNPAPGLHFFADIMKR